MVPIPCSNQDSEKLIIEIQIFFLVISLFKLPIIRSSVVEAGDDTYFLESDFTLFCIIDKIYKQPEFYQKYKFIHIWILVDWFLKITFLPWLDYSDRTKYVSTYYIWYSNNVLICFLNKAHHSDNTWETCILAYIIKIIVNTTVSYSNTFINGTHLEI